MILTASEDIPRFLKDLGFEDVQVQRSDLPVGKWAGQEGVINRENAMEVYRAVKQPILRMGGFGMVRSESEADELLDNVEKEWDEVEGTYLKYCLIVARKPST
jgi:hypothetical protein